MTTTIPTVLRRLPLPALLALCLPACHKEHAEHKEHGHGPQRIVATSPQTKDVLITQEYVCQIRSQNSIEVRPLQEGYLKEIYIKEGQTVQQGDPMFEIVPVLYSTRLDAERAKARTVQIKYDNAVRLFNRTPPIVSEQEVKLAQAELDEANARVKTAEAELTFTTIRAPFTGIVDRQLQQRGSLVDKKDVLTTLYDNSTMWVYFNVPEANYLEYKGRPGKPQVGAQLKLADSRIELYLADGSRFGYDAGDTVTIEGKFNNETGNIPFRADFQNPDGLLRHGQTGTVYIRRKLHDALVIPQRATFEFLDKRYVYVVGDDNVVHQRLITVQHEQDDIFILKKGLGLDVKDKIILEGVKQVSDGQKLDQLEFKSQDAVQPKYPAE